MNDPGAHPAIPDRTITIVMYHYVRDLARSRFPEIKGLTTDHFERQLRYLRMHHTPIRMEDLLSAVMEDSPLPANACLLTFDDGYIDHFLTVFPLLDRYGVQGSFFPTVRTVRESRVLDANKIHFILAAVNDKRRIVSRLFAALDDLRRDLPLEGNEELFGRYAIAGRFDSAEIVFVKRVLQKHLPESVRSMIIDRLFSEFVSREEKAFARELYMDLDQIRCMRRHGMFFGGHGAGHYWMDSLSPPEQEREVEASLELLADIGVEPDRRVFCYPYGGYNRSLVDILRGRGFRLALTADPEIASLDIHDPLALPRLDTNDLPGRPAA